MALGLYLRTLNSRQWIISASV